MRMRSARAALLLALFLSAGGVALAADQVVVVVGTDSPDLERFAAEELSRQFESVFVNVDAQVRSAPEAGAVAQVLIGSPATNPHVRTAIGAAWPDVSDQGFVIRTLGDRNPPALVVGGGSPAATLWAVYELGHRLGIRYLLRGDILPAERRPLDLSGYDLVQEPVLRVRCWRTINAFAMGPESWGLADHERFLRQLAKLKFNEVLLQVWPWQPFVTFEFDGVRKQTAVLWFGERYPVDGETAGKKAFAGKSVFENPDFAGLSTPEELTSAGIEHVRGLIDAAHRLGMRVGLSISPLEFPREFQQVLSGARIARSPKDLTIRPAADQELTDPVLLRLVETQIRAYLDTYPEIDSLYLTLPEFPEWDQHFEAAWDLLAPRLKDPSVSLESMIREARSRSLTASGDRGVQSVKGNLVALAFFHLLFDGERFKKDPLIRRDGHPVDVIITDVDAALFPVLDAVVPLGAGTLNFVDYTARRVAENRQLLRNVPAQNVRSRLILTLADDNIGMLPQSSLKSLGVLMHDLQELGWEGFSTRYWVPGELDPSVYYLSRAAWERGAQPRDVFLELFTSITGNASAAERLWLGWEALEAATDLIDQHDLGFAFPVEGMLLKHDSADPVPEWWSEASRHYSAYTTEVYRARGAGDLRAKDLLYYYAKRAEYVGEYFNAVKAVREAGIAKAAGDRERAVELLEQAVQSTYNGINSLADVAQDQSDRGLIAVLNAYAYRPVLAEYERLADEE